MKEELVFIHIVNERVTGAEILELLIKWGIIGKNCKNMQHEED